MKSNFFFKHKVFCVESYIYNFQGVLDDFKSI